MSFRVRGQEAFVTFVSEDLGALSGSFAKVKELTITPRTDLVETPYLSETFDDLDIQHHGFDFTFSVDEEDSSTADYLAAVITREELHFRPGRVTMQVQLVYREPGRLPTTYLLHEIVMKVNEVGFSGRKEYVSSTYEGKAKRLTVI